MSMFISRTPQAKNSIGVLSARLFLETSPLADRCFKGLFHSAETHLPPIDSDSIEFRKPTHSTVSIPQHPIPELVAEFKSNQPSSLAQASCRFVAPCSRVSTR